MEDTFSSGIGLCCYDRLDPSLEERVTRSIEEKKTVTYKIGKQQY